MDKNFLQNFADFGKRRSPTQDTTTKEDKPEAEAPEYVGDLSKTEFADFLGGLMQRWGLVKSSAGQKKTAYNPDPDKRLSDDEKPGTGGRRKVTLSNSEKPGRTVKGAGFGFLARGGTNQPAVRTKDLKDLAGQVADDLDERKDSPLYKRFGL